MRALGVGSWEFALGIGSWGLGVILNFPMNPGALRALEFDRIVSVITDLALTPTGAARLEDLRPLTDTSGVIAAQRATTEGVRFLVDNPGFPLRAPSDLEAILDALGVDGRPLEPLRLLGLSDYLESIELSRNAISKLGPTFPILTTLVQGVASFRNEIADVRRKIDAGGDVADNASPTLAGIRDRLRKQKQRLRNTLESFLRGRDTSKYLQEQVVTDRNGRYVLVVRAEHRSSIPGIIHGASASGASLFLEPLSTVEINNDIVALEEQEHEEVRRILAQLTNAFRARPADLRRTLDVATELDFIQAKARFSQIVDGIEPAISSDGTFELRGARHPLLIKKVWSRDSGSDAPSEHESRPLNPVPVDVLLIPPVRILLITGPNTGGKTVAIKTAGLLAAMAQAGLHIPAEHGSRLPVFRSLFADIGDEQSISASLSTFSGHITNVVSMDRDLTLPALVLLDEVGAGTDPVEGGALGTAVIDHFRQRGSHLIATTHYDALKTYAATTEGVQSAAFGFDADTFAPTYRLIYGSPGRSLAIEIAARLGMPASVIKAARANLGDREKQLADHLAKMDSELRAVEHERRLVARERQTVADTEQRLRSREDAIRNREETFNRRLNERLDEQLRAARREIDTVIEGLKARTAEMTAQAARLVTHTISTGEAGAARSDARAAVDKVIHRVKHGTGGGASAGAPEPSAPVVTGARVAVGGLGLEGTVVHVHDGQAEVDVRGKRLRAAVKDLRVVSAAPATTSAPAGSVRVNVDLQPRETSLSDLNVIGCTVDEAISRAEKFLDESTVTDQRTVRLIHGHGTGQLRRALAEFLKGHPLVARFQLAPPDQGGGGVTVVELKD
jgi:DNA mismatch repair protein MutS2